jgi:uncharacterized membrane protein YeaQ/YmgE (transglycosylase-associated protein family)
VVKGSWETCSSASSAPSWAAGSSQFGHAGASGINLYSILVSAVGAVVVLVVYHALSGRRIHA